MTLTYTPFSFSEIEERFREFVSAGEVFTDKYMTPGTTPAYISPEQPRNGPRTFHADPDCPHFPSEVVWVEPLRRTSYQHYTVGCDYCVSAPHRRNEEVLRE